MQVSSVALLARIYTDEDALWGDEPLFTVIVRRALEAQLAGATVLQGSLGYGHSARLHAHRPLSLDDNMPVVVEIVDAEAPLRAFVETLGEFHEIGLVTFERVEIARFGNQSA